MLHGEDAGHGPDASVLMGLDGVTFLSDAVAEPPTGEHWTVLSFQL